MLHLSLFTIFISYVVYLLCSYLVSVLMLHITRLTVQGTIDSCHHELHISCGPKNKKHHIWYICRWVTWEGMEYVMNMFIICHIMYKMHVSLWYMYCTTEFIYVNVAAVKDSYWTAMCINSFCHSLMHSPIVDDTPKKNNLISTSHCESSLKLNVHTCQSYLK